VTVAYASDSVLMDMAQLGRMDLFYFITKILRYDRYRPEVHTEMTQELMGLEPDKWMMTLWPRGTFKSTTASVCYPLWQIARDTDPNNPSPYGSSRTLLMCYNEEKAKGYLSEIRGHLENEESLFRALYRGVRGVPLSDVPKGQKYTATGLTLMHCKRIRKEPNIMVCGTGNVPTGFHFDRIICDDIVDPELVESDIEREKVKAALQNCIPLLDPGGVGVVIGTRWHADDVYGWIKGSAKAMGFTVLEKAAINKRTGVINFPTIFTKEFLAQTKVRLGPRKFACNYLNDPTEDEDRPFREILWREIRSLPDDDWEFGVFCDPNDSETAKSDWTAVAIVAHAKTRHLLFVCRAVMRRQYADKTPQLLFELACDAADNWVPRFKSKRTSATFKGIVCESFMFQRLIQTELKHIMLNKNRIFPVYQLPRDSTQSKKQRITGMKPRFDANGVMFNAEMKTDEDMGLAVRQVLNYPADHDDFPDCLSQCNQVFEPIKNRDDIVAECDNVSKTIDQINDERRIAMAKRDREAAFAVGRRLATIESWFTGEGSEDGEETEDQGNTEDTVQEGIWDD
jgi:hypothetical protein